MNDAEFLYQLLMAPIDPSVPEHAQQVLRDVRNSREQVRIQAKQYDELAVQFNLASQDRDARRRRMELAQLILNYEQELPIEELWLVATHQHVTLDAQQYADWNARINGSRNLADYFGQPRPFGMSSEQLTNLNVDIAIAAAAREVNHVHKVQVDSERRILSSFCECGQFVADVAWKDPTQQPTVISTDDSPKQPQEPSCLKAVLSNGEPRCQSWHSPDEGKTKLQCVYGSIHLDEPHMDHASYEW